MNNISIKLKLLILSAVSLIILSVSLGTISYNKSIDSLVTLEFEKLQAIRDFKKYQVEEVFHQYKEQINLLRNMTYVTDLLKDYKKLYSQIKVTSHSSFPIDDDEVAKTKMKWDKFYKNYTHTYSIENVLVISRNYGHVFYTYKNNEDYGANILYGEYRNTNLAKLWNKVRESKKTSFIDMESYSPNDSKPTMFIGTPIYVNSVFEAVLILQIDNSSIQNIMNYRSDYAASQEDYLVGPDYLMRSDSFLSPITHSLHNSFKHKESGKVETKPIKNSFKGIKQSEITQDYLGEMVLSSYDNIVIDENISWAIVSEINLSEVTGKTEELRNSILFVTLLTFFSVLLCTYLIIKKYIINSLNRFQNGLLDFFKYLNRENTEIKLLEDTSSDEIGIMSKAVNIGILQTKDNIQKTDKENWLKTGVHELNQILINANTLQKTCEESINFVSDYVKAGVGVFYMFDKEDKILYQYAAYAHVQRDELSASFRLGDGVIGQVGLQKKPIYLKRIKRDDNLITTGIITQEALNSYTFPLIHNDELFAVIEIASFDIFKKEEIEFFDLISKTICLSLSTALQNNIVNELLKKTEKSNIELEQNQKELEIANASMEKQQKQLEEANASMEEQQQQLEEANASMEEQQQQIEEANASMEEQQQQLVLSEQNLKLQNAQLENTKKEIQAKADELEKSGKYKSEFLANMSHELRTPLNSIILLSSLLQKNSKQTLNEHDIRKAKTIFDSGNELLRLINDILDLSKVESGKMQIIVDSFSSNDLLRQMKDVFDFTAKDKGLEFLIIDEYGKDIKSDRDRISQIIRNLVSNAFKFTQQGSITLKISKAKKEEFDFRISVIDTGMGIPREKQELIFKAFMQADGGTSREFGGTGLGLSISKELSKLLGGTLSLESTVGIGSDFYVELPILEKEDINEVRAINIERKTHIAPIVIMNNTGYIKDDRDILKNDEEAYLIIDDDKTFTEVVYDEIKKSNSYGLIALDGTSGLALVEKYNIKGIMLDLTLPDMDGIDVLTKLKSNNKTRHIPIHVISSKDKTNDTLELGAIGYLQKPVYDGDISKIITTIDSFKEKKIKDLLIVEDNKVQREALIELVGEGVNIVGVKSSAQAIKEVKKEKYDTVVIDLGLDGGNGYEVCEFIKNRYPSLPIIIYTGKDLTQEENMKLHEYSNSIIIKTVNSNERILSEINLFLHRDNEEEKNELLKSEIFETVDLSDKRILIVDDDIKNIFVLESALQEFEAQTITAFNGLEAINLLKEDPNVDLILMDIMMPVMDGYEAIEKIRKDEKTKHIPIIAVTAKAMKEDREKCISIGADDYLPKPIDINILSNLISIWSNKKHK